MRSIELWVRGCAPENLETPGLVLTHHPGMTFDFYSAAWTATFFGGKRP